MRSSRIGTAALLLASSLLLTVFPALATPPQFTVETALRRLWDLSDMPALRREKLRMASSGAVYPRAKDKSEFLYRDSNGDYVLFDAVGPGCLVRYWSALVEEGTRIRFYFDGNTTPDLDMQLQDMFTGKTYPWLLPLVGNPDTSSGGSFSYMPIPFAKGCKVALDRVPSFYQVEALQFTDRSVETFNLQRMESYRPAIEKAVAELQSRSAFPPPGDAVAATARLLPGQTFKLIETTGPAVITEIDLQLEPFDPDLLREVLIRGFWEGEKDPSIWSPLGDFFVTAFSKADYVSLPLASNEHGFYCRFPMPFERSGRLEIVNESDHPIDVRYRVAHQRLASFPEEWGRFHAHWDRVETRLGEYVRLLNAIGTGKYVGMSLNAQGISPWMLEGDEVAWVDGELTPSIHGTGTEDYFSGAWYFKNGPFHLPFHGAPMLELRPLGQASRVSLYRFHLLDPISFQERMRLNLEHGQENTMQGSDYSFTVFYYQNEPHRASFRTLPVLARLQTKARVLDYLARLRPWQEAVSQKNGPRIIELGTGLLADFEQEGNLNRVRYVTGQALLEAGRIDEAVKIWRSAPDYFGVDHWQTRLCQTKAWLFGGRKGPSPRSLLAVNRLGETQIPGKFDQRVWSGLHSAEGFRPGFPDPYYDLPADVQTEVKLAHDQTHLYIRAICWEPRIAELASSPVQKEYFDQKEDAIVVCLDSSLSFESYLMIAVNPKGRVSAGTATGGDVWSGRRKMDLNLSFNPVVSLGPDYWKVELQVPLSALGLTGDLAQRLIGVGLIRVRNAGQQKPEITMWGKGLVPMLPSEFGLAQFE